MDDLKRVVSLVIGTHVNAYSVVSELHAHGVENLVVASESKSICSSSRKLRRFERTRGGWRGVRGLIESLSREFERVVIFPTEDRHIEWLDWYREELPSNTIHPVRPGMSEWLDKQRQYVACREVGVPCPNFHVIRNARDMDAELETLRLPLLIKPTKRTSLAGHRPLRNILVINRADIRRACLALAAAVNNGDEFLAMEVVPGPSSNIFSYAAYRDSDGVILNEWSGRKLSQYPNDFGVFASAINERIPVVESLGRQLVHRMGLTGFSQPEFKYDERDGQYKLMEVNLRSMMWNYVGFISGVSLHYTYYLNALGLATPSMPQSPRPFHFVNLAAELENLMSRRRYWGTFRSVAFPQCDRHWACFDRADPVPFMRTLLSVPINIAKRWTRAALNHS